MNLSGWEIAGSFGTVAAALTGAVLGIKAEVRAHRYKPEWTIYADDATGRLVALNRTGEDATSVTVFTPGHVVDGHVQLVRDGETFSPEVTAYVDGEPRIEWSRPKTARRYGMPFAHASHVGFRARVAGVVRGAQSGYREQSRRGRRL